MKTELEILDRMVELIEAGWTKGRLCRRPNGQFGSATDLLDGDVAQVCLSGALTKASSEIEDASWTTTIRRVSKALSNAVGDSGIVGFNDAPDTTKEDVLLALKLTRDELL